MPSRPKASPPRGQKRNGQLPPSGTDGKRRARRLTYREQQERAALPATIESLEAEIETLHQAMAEAEFYQQPGAEIAPRTGAAQGPGASVGRMLRALGIARAARNRMAQQHFTDHLNARFSPRLCRGIESPVHSDLPDRLAR